MSTLLRDVASAEAADHDLIVVGGGITGACVALEAARRGLRALLLERDDFGARTSANSLRILHGGLRYLQTLDLPRVLTSIHDRRWFSRHFPDLVEPLPCLMPLDGAGLRRAPVVGAALMLNDLLAAGRNKGVPPGARLPRGRALSAAETLELCPALEGRGVRGSALWYDTIMTRSERVLIEILRWSVRSGATVLNYTRAVSLLTRSGEVHAVETEDMETGERMRFRAPVVVNCAGPWTTAVAASFGSDAPDLFNPALAFNVLLDRRPVAPLALALTDPQSDHTYFIVPWKGQVLAGTEHLEWEGTGRRAEPSAEQVEALLGRLRAVVPGLEGITRADVVRVMAGLLPAVRRGHPKPRSSDVLHEHRARGGPSGLYSVVGVKYTTAPRLARRALDRIYGAGRPRRAVGRREPLTGTGCGEIGSPDWLRCVQREAVFHLDDLLLRRMAWPGEAPPADAALADLAARRGWDPERQRQERERFRTAVGWPGGDA